MGHKYIWVTLFYLGLHISKATKNVLKNPLDHSLAWKFFLNLVQCGYRLCWKRISSPVFYRDLVYKLKSVKGAVNFISSSLKIVQRIRRRKNDPVIIERNLGLVFGPFTALYRPLPMCSTLTHTAMWMLWRTLSRSPQRR